MPVGTRLLAVGGGLASGGGTAASGGGAEPGEQDVAREERTPTSGSHAAAAAPEREAAGDGTDDRDSEARPPGPGRHGDEHLRGDDPGSEGGFPFGRPGRPLTRTSPFFVGFTGGLGVLIAWFLVQALVSARQVLVLIVVSMFLAVALSPAVEGLQRWGLARRWAVGIVFLGVIAFFVGFGFAVVPPLTEQITTVISAVPEYVRELQNNPTINRLDQRYQLLERAEEFLAGGSLGQQAFGGLVGAGVVVLSAVFSTLTVLILTLYFLASLPAIKRLAYRLAPRSRRNRVRLLGDEILARVGGYVGGVMLIAGINGTATFVFLQILDIPYALTLAMVVALFGVIPMIGATLGAIVVTVVAFAHSLPLAIACIVYYLVYQQVENYIIYPRVMKSSVNVPPTATIIAALIGGALLGVVGALLAIPSAAAISLMLREVVMPRQERA